MSLSIQRISGFLQAALRRLWQSLRRGPVTAGLFLLISIFLWGFIELADEIVEGDTDSLDRSILLLLRHPDDPTRPLGPGWFAEGVRDLTALGSTSVLVLITLGVAGFLLLTRKYRFIIFLISSVLGGWMVSFGLKAWFDRPRPDFVTPLTPVMTPSFPSGHSMMSAVVYLTLGTLLITLVKTWKLRIYILAFSVSITVLVGLSRIYLGVHYPTDVLAGWIMGASWALICWMLIEWLQGRGKVDSASSDNETELNDSTVLHHKK